MLPTKFRFIWPSGFREDFFRNQPIRNKNCFWWPCFCQWIGTKLAIFIKDLPRMLPTKFRFIWPSVFREDFFQKSTNQKQELPVVAMFVNGSARNEQSLEDLPQMLPTKFRFIWPSDFRGEDLKKLANQKQELPMVAMFANGSVQNEHCLERTFHRCFLPSFTSFG